MTSCARKCNIAACRCCHRASICWTNGEMRCGRWNRERCARHCSNRRAQRRYRRPRPSSSTRRNLNDAGTKGVAIVARVRQHSVERAVFIRRCARKYRAIDGSNAVAIRHWSVGASDKGTRWRASAPQSRRGTRRVLRARLRCRAREGVARSAAVRRDGAVVQRVGE